MGGMALDSSVNEDWWWLKKSPLPATLILTPAIVAGTVAVTNNSTDITFSSGPAADSDNWFFKVNDHEDIFRISAHTAAGTAATLDSVYTGSTDATASYKLFKMQYDLASDVLRVNGPMTVFRDGHRRKYEIDGVEMESLQRDYPLARVLSGVPESYAMVDEDTVQFSRYGGDGSDTTDLIRIEYGYLQRPSVLTDSGAEEPLVPWQFRHLLSDIGVFFLFLDKDDNRADGAGLLAKAGIKAMSVEHKKKITDVSRNFGKIMPRQGRTNRYLRPLRTESGHIIG